MKVYVKYHNPHCKIQQHGNWIDLKSAKDYNITELDLSGSKFVPIGEEKVDSTFYVFKLITLGVSMKLPKHFEANIVPRSSTFIKYGMLQTNHFGVIDSSYSGDKDQWFFPAMFVKPSIIKEGERICQFSIRPSMDAPWYVKLKWLFSKIEFVEVDMLSEVSRGGFGSSGY